MSQTHLKSIQSEADVEDKTKLFSKLRIIKNLVVVSLGTLLILGADDIVLTFQSTMNREKSVGVVSMVIQYAFGVISSFFLPKYLVLKYGSKIIMILSIFMFMPFFVVNYYPIHSLMFLTTAINGVGFSLLCGSIDPYINNLSNLYVDHHLTELSNKRASDWEKRNASTPRKTSLGSSVTTKSFIDCLGDDISSEKKTVKDYNSSKNIKEAAKLSPETSTSNMFNNKAELDNKNNNKSILESTTARFFGFYSMIYQTCFVFSSLASYFVLQNGYPPDRLPISNNETCSCGAAYCNVETLCSEHNLQQPSTEARIFLFSVCVVLCFIAGTVVIAFMDDLKMKNRHVLFSMDMSLATFRQIRKKEHLLLAPLSVNVGIMKGFYLGDFTKSYIGCAWGIQYVGLVTACAGASMVFFSTVSGWFTKHLGRLPIFLMAAAFNTGLNVILNIWKPDASNPAMFFVAAGLWGGLFGTFHTQTRAFYGVLFKKDEEAAFGAYQLWYSVGACLCLSYSEYVCNDIKINLMIAVSTLGIIGYLIVEISHSLTINQKLPPTSNKNHIKTECMK